MTRREAIEALEYLISGECTDTQMDYVDEIQMAITDMKAVEDFRTVPAVPLDKLCEFLEKCGADSYCGTCKQIMGGCFTDGKGCGSKYFWEELLTKWMEEQDAAEKDT